MKLLKIGRAPGNDIVLHSEKASSLHAELTLLDSGDMQLEDKGSMNGTFIMNQRIQPGKPVNVRRGDAIRFGDVELQWGQVPMPEDNSAYKAIYGIGSNFNNTIQISGATVSRYHATVKVGRDGKVYIVDHSKNGTTVDGTKIQPNTPYRIKRSSAIVCGGVPVSLRDRDFWPSDAWKKVLAIAASIVVICGVGVGVWKIIKPDSNRVTLEALQNATACVFERYYVEITFKDDPFIGKINNWPETWKFGMHNGSIALGTLTGKDITPFGGRGTAFFISKDGELGTNRHIARPWLYLSNDEKDEIRQIMQKFLSQRDGLLVRILISAIQSGSVSADDAQAWLDRLQKSDYEISGSFDYIGVALTHTSFSTIADLLSCQVIAESGSDERDVALLRLNSQQTPEKIVKGGYFDITKARVDEQSLKPQEEELTTIGYPAQFGIDNDFVGKGTELLPTIHRTYISKTPDDDMFQLQSNVVGGQSGSPIIDKKHRLVGIVWGSHRGTEVAYGCNIKHLKELYDKHKSRN